MSDDPGNSLARRIWAGAGWTVLGAGAGRLAFLAAMVLAARTLGQDGFGALAFVQSTLGVLGLFAGLGLGATLARYLAATRCDDPDRAGRIIGLVWRLTVITLGLSTLGLLVAAPWLAQALAAEPSYDARVSGLIVGAVLMALVALRGLQDGALHGFEAFATVAGLRMTEGLLALVAVPVLASMFGVPGAVAGLALASALPIVLGALPLVRALNAHGISIRGTGWRQELPVLFGFSAPNLLAGLAAAPTLWLAMVWLAQSGPSFEAVGLYGAAYQWHGPLIFAPTALTAAALPIFSRCLAEDPDRFLRAFAGTALGCLCLAALPAAGLILFRKPVLATYGPEFAEASHALIWLALAAPVHALSKLTGHALLALDRAWTVFALNAVWAGILLISAWHWIPASGATGLAGAFCLAYGALAAGSLVAIWAIGLPRAHHPRWRFAGGEA